MINTRSAKLLSLLFCTSLAGFSAVATAQSNTPHLDAVEQTLLQLAPGSEGSVWERTTGNTISEYGANDSSWLLQTPNCWGDASCTDGNKVDDFADRIYQDISVATEWVDITTLVTYPDGLFQAAIVKGLKEALSQNPDLTVRILGGTPPGMGNFKSIASESAQNYMDRLTNDLGDSADGAKIIVSGVETYWLYSWNHSKIIAVDSKTAIVGGHNLWEGAYGGTTNPISDVSMRLSGPAAESAHKFADELWNFACTWGDSWWNSTFYVDLVRADSMGNACPSKHTTVPAQTSDGVEVMALGGLGYGMDVPGGTNGGLEPANDSYAACSRWYKDYYNNDAAYSVANPEEEGLRALIASANDNIFLSQQDLLAPCVAPISNARYDARLFNILADKLVAEVPVRIMVSTPGAGQGLLAPYSNMKKMTDISDILIRKIKNRANVSEDRAKEIACNSLQLASIRIEEGVDEWGTGDKVGNHSKVISVDDAAFYVGSKNLYPTTLQDFGFIVEDAEAAAAFTRDYKDRSWANSKLTATVDFEAGVCNL